MSRMKKYLVCSALVMSLSACGGGSSGTATEPSNNDSPGGIWVGTSTSTETGITYQTVGFITETGEVRFLAEDGEQTVGTVSVNGKTFTASLTSYAPIGYVFDNGLTVITGTADGTLNERSSFAGSAKISGEVVSSFQFTYDQIYERGSSFSQISGIYSDSDEFGYTETYVIDEHGVITGSDTDGCQMNGNVKILNPSYNMYRINIEVTSCGALNGSYSGLAALMDEGGAENDTLAISVSGTRYVISGAIPRN